MKTIRAIYENGVFRPVERVEDFKEHALVEFEPRPVAEEETTRKAKDSAYDILGERYASGERDVAARHDEHQP